MKPVAAMLTAKQKIIEAIVSVERITEETLTTYADHLSVSLIQTAQTPSDVWIPSVRIHVHVP